MSQAPSIQWGLRPLLSAISSQFENELRLAGHPPLVSGHISFGAKSLDARKSPPSITAVWVSSGSLGVIYGQDGNTTRAQPVLGSLATELLRLDFHCWGADNPPDVESVGAYDHARFLCHMLWRVIHRLAEGAYRVLGIDVGGASTAALGAHAILKVELACPVVDNLISYLPSGTVGSVTVESAVGQPAATFSVGAVT